MSHRPSEPERYLVTFLTLLNTIIVVVRNKFTYEGIMVLVYLASLGTLEVRPSVSVAGHFSGLRSHMDLEDPCSCRHASGSAAPRRATTIVTTPTELSGLRHALL